MEQGSLGDNKNIENRLFLIRVLLWVCLFLFAFRVLFQWLASQFPETLSFDIWHSGAVSYQTLLLSQLAIIAAMFFFTVRMSHGQVKPNKVVGRALQIIGSLYFILMCSRLIISLLGISDTLWFNRPIPSFFHMVLATYLIVSGVYHVKFSKDSNDE